MRWKDVGELKEATAGLGETYSAALHFVRSSRKEFEERGAPWVNKELQSKRDRESSSIRRPSTASNYAPLELH